MSDITMDAIMANIFLSIQTRLATSSDLKFIDQDLGQLEIDDLNERELPVKFPCALIDFPDVDFSDDSSKIQQGEGMLQIRLGITAYTAATHYFKDDRHKINALEYYNIEHRVNTLLHGWSDDQYFNPLTRRKAKTERRNDNVRVRVITYTFGYRDNTAMDVPAKTIARPDLKINI